MRTLLLATTNPGKAKELSEGLSDLGVTIASLKDFPGIVPVAEIGKTFEGNAILKARGYGDATGMPALADDAGLEIDALGGEPGVKTRRWIHGDRDSTDEELIEYTLERMKGIPKKKRTACLRTVIAFYDGREMFTSTAAIEGYIAAKAAKDVEPGYPYRSLLFIPKFGKLYKDLTKEEHAECNHRLQALTQLKPVIAAKLI